MSGCSQLALGAPLTVHAPAGRFSRGTPAASHAHGPPPPHVSPPSWPGCAGSALRLRSQPAPTAHRPRRGHVDGLLLPPSRGYLAAGTEAGHPAATPLRTRRPRGERAACQARMGRRPGGCRALSRALPCPYPAGRSPGVRRRRSRRNSPGGLRRHARRMAAPAGLRESPGLPAAGSRHPGTIPPCSRPCPAQPQAGRAPGQTASRHPLASPIRGGASRPSSKAARSPGAPVLRGPAGHPDRRRDGDQRTRGDRPHRTRHDLPPRCPQQRRRHFQHGSTKRWSCDSTQI